MGRPPGALAGAPRRHVQDWELRDSRFEEIDSDEDEGGQGVVLDPNSFSARHARAAQQAFVSDELYFDGYDLGQNRRARRREMYGYGQYGEDVDPEEWEMRNQRGMAYQAAVREKEEALIQSALARIARAHAKGKTNVNLSQQEMEALERRRGQQPESTAATALASPPPTPAKSLTKSKGSGSRSNSSTNLASQKTRKRGSSGLFGTTSSSPAKSNSKAKVDRKPSAEQALSYPAGQHAQGIMVPGPNGVPVYAPIGYYNPPSPETLHNPASTSRSGSRSTSKQRRRDSTPPDRNSAAAADLYAQYPPRYFPPPSSSNMLRPRSSSSNRSLPDDVDWLPPAPRTRAALPPYQGYPTDYDPQTLPAAHGHGQSHRPRRHVSGPADLRYTGSGGGSNNATSLRRVPAASSTLAQRNLRRPDHPLHTHSDPSGRKASGLAQELEVESPDDDDQDDDEEESEGGRGEGSGSSDTEGSGVQVDILADDARGYTISRTPAVSHGGGAAGHQVVLAPAAAAGGNEGRRRARGGRR